MNARRFPLTAGRADLDPRPLASALNLHWRVDPALVRFTSRIRRPHDAGRRGPQGLNLPHGYWLPFTMVVVAGSPTTARPASARASGFWDPRGQSCRHLLICGCIRRFRSWMIAMSATISSSGFLVKRNYGLAVFL